MFERGLFTLRRPICDCFSNHPSMPASEIYGWDIRETGEGLALVLRCRICSVTLITPGHEFKMGIQIIEPRAAPHHGYQIRMDMDLDIEELNLDRDTEGEVHDPEREGQLLEFKQPRKPRSS